MDTTLRRGTTCYRHIDFCLDIPHRVPDVEVPLEPRRACRADYYVRALGGLARPRARALTVSKAVSMRGNILIVDDDEDAANVLAEVLRRRGFETSSVASAHDCLEQLTHQPADVVVTDMRMTGMSGIELCTVLRDRHPELRALVVTGQGGFEAVVAAMRAGAYDYITKPVNIDALDIAIVRAIEHLQLRCEVKRLRWATGAAAVAGIEGDSRAVRDMLALIRRVAASDTTVLIRGESGTGKELVARALHQLSSRGAHPFVAINCAAMPAPLLESELFGHVRGAFTDARTSRPGLFVRAGAGTMFLDEIGEMPLDMQVKLLRVLQERMVRPVGSDQEVPFEARVITSTNRDLAREVEAMRFREDLFYRINVVEVVVPPLRDRGGDVLRLAQSFLRRIGARIGKPVVAITPAAARLLVGYHWPGNVRELENCMERAVAICQLDQISLDDLPRKLTACGTKFLSPTDAPSELLTIAEMEQRYLRQVLTVVGGNKTRAARVLGIDRRSLYRRLEQAAGDHDSCGVPRMAARATLDASTLRSRPRASAVDGDQQ
jgi:two-component system response regulator HydG